MGPRLKQLPRTCEGGHHGRHLTDHQVWPGRTKNLEADLGPLPSSQDQCRRPLLTPGGDPGGQEPGRALGSRARQTAAQPGPAPPLGALLGEVARRPPTHSGCREGSRPAARCTEFQPRSRAAARRVTGAGGAGLAPPRPSGGRGIVLPVGGVAARAPPPHPPARVKCGRRLRSLQLPGSPHLGQRARAVTCSSCPGGSARRLRSAAAPPSLPAGSGESKGLGALRGLWGCRRPARPGDRT